jgi:hypothetical protein
VYWANFFPEVSGRLPSHAHRLAAALLTSEASFILFVFQNKQTSFTLLKKTSFTLLTCEQNVFLCSYILSTIHRSVGH